MLKLENISVSFSDEYIINDVSILFGIGVNRISGTNGSGKSTLIKTISGVVKAKSGRIWINSANKPVKFLLYRHGFFVSDTSDFYGFMRGQDIISLATRYKSSSISDIKYYLDGFGIYKYMSTRFSDMSFGTKKKYLLASMFISDVLVYLLDEPTNGLDQRSISFLYENIKKLSKKKVIILISHDEGFISGLESIEFKISEGSINQVDKLNESVI